MKQSVISFGLIAIALLFLFQSCKKDEFTDLEVSNPPPNVAMEHYDEFGPKLEKVVDLALKEDAFKYTLYGLTSKKTLGDWEVLMSTFLKEQSKDGTKMKDILLKKANGFFDEAALDAFLEAYPSLIIATRGDLGSWLKGEYSAPTVFVKSDFNEKAKKVIGTKDEKFEKIALDQKFENAVIVMHISERHDKFGNPMTGTNTNQYAKNDEPGVGFGGGGSGGGGSEPEPSSCTAPIIVSFDSETVNGGIQLNYEIDNFPESLGSWGKIYITRVGPPVPGGNGDPEIITIYRNADDPRVFYDLNTSPNITYTYTLSARVSVIDPNSQNPFPDADWIICEANNTLNTTAVAGDVLERLNSFVGANQNSSTLKYNWYPPSGFPVSQYRLRVWNENTNRYELMTTVNGNSSNYFHTFNVDNDCPTCPDLRGDLVEMQIQYRGATGNWSGDFFDRTYASYRDPHQPLHWYGIQVPDVQVYEQGVAGESLLFGAPEIRIFAIQGAGSLEDSRPIERLRKIIFTTQLCSETVVYYHPWVGRIEYERPTGDIYVDNSKEPVDILYEWDNNLAGGAVKIAVTETDISEVLIDESSAEYEAATKHSLNVDFGFKADIVGIANVDLGGVQIGTESEWGVSSDIEYAYPASDLYIDIFTIYYHYEHILEKNNNLYGYFPFLDNVDQADYQLECDLLEEHL